MFCLQCETCHGPGSLHVAADGEAVLQELLALPVPEYHHHRLVTDAAGKRFAKRDGAASLRALRAAGVDSQLFFTPKDNHIYEMISLTRDDDETAQAVVRFIRER